MTGSELNLALVSPLYTPYYGGVERHVEMIAKELVKKDINVQVLCVDPTNTLPPSETIDNVPVRRFSSLGKDGFFFSRSMWRWLHQHIREFDLIHVHSYHTPVALQGSMQASRNNIPYVFTPHYHGTGHTQLRKLLHIPYFVPGSWMVRNARMNICVSSSEKNLLTDHFGDNIRVCVIPNGIDTSLIDIATPLPIGNKGKIILTVGRLEKYKRFDLVIQTMAYLPNEFQLFIIGVGSQKTALEALTRQLNLTDRVKFLGRVSDETLASWYRTADVFITLSLHEAFGLTLLESIAGGCTVVASDIAAFHDLAEYIDEGVVSYIPLDEIPESIAKSVEEQASLGRNYYKSRFQELSWMSIAKHVIDVYDMIL